MSIYDLEYIKIPSKRQVLGMAFPMRWNGVGGYVTANENLTSLRDCVKQLLLTSRGARVMRPDYGTDIRKSVFEPLTVDVIDNLRGQILSTIRTYEPRVLVNKISLTPDYETNKLHIALRISSKDDLLNETLVEVLV